MAFIGDLGNFFLDDSGMEGGHQTKTLTVPQGSYLFRASLTSRYTMEDIICVSTDPSFEYWGSIRTGRAILEVSGEEEEIIICQFKAVGI